MTLSRPELSVLARIRSSAALLGPSEAKVASIVLERAHEVVEWSTAELAQAAGTSTATVIRACQSLGFRGFQHLRLELARSAPMRAHEGDDIAAGTFDDAVEAVRLAQESVSPARVIEAADLLRRARRVVLVSNGFSGPPLQDFAMRLSTLGRAVEAPIDTLAQQFAANSLGEGDLCFALSYSGANVQTLRACAAAHDRGARGRARDELRPVADRSPRRRRGRDRSRCRGARDRPVPRAHRPHRRLARAALGARRCDDGDGCRGHAPRRRRRHRRRVIEPHR
ncbi:MAG: MurR/RpiR family transcriptional regulator [Microbacterium arborescens]